jgi:membrane protease YdiL (CAAX protease family)
LENLTEFGASRLWLSYLLGSLPYFIAYALLILLKEASWSPPYSSQQYLLKILINPFATALLGAVGEEIGWRGYLQPTLRQYYSPTPTFFIVGIAWSYWHLIANLDGYNGSFHPVLTALVTFPIQCTAWAFILGWIRERTGRIGLCAICHGVINSVSNFRLVTSKNETIEQLAVATSTALIAFLLMKAFPLRENLHPRAHKAL